MHSSCYQSLQHKSISTHTCAMNRCVSSTLHTCALSLSTPNATSADNDGAADDDDEDDEADTDADTDESPPATDDDDDASAAVAVAAEAALTYPPSLTNASSSARPPV